VHNISAYWLSAGGYEKLAYTTTTERRPVEPDSFVTNDQQHAHHYH